MHTELEALRKRVEALEREVGALKAERASLTDQGVSPREEETTEPRESPAQAPTPAITKQPRRPDLEAQVGGVWLNRIAILLLVLGAIYGFSWAVDNDYIGPIGIVSLGYGVGLALLAIGRSTHRKGYAGWALGVTGGGLAVFYASTFAAFQLYQLIPYGAAFGLMVLFTLFGGVLSLWYDAAAIAWLGALGGFLTPFLLYTGSNNVVGLLTYTAVLDCGILALAYGRQWRSLNLLGLLATWIIFGLGWARLWFERDIWPPHFAFAALYFVLFTLAACLYNLVRQERATILDLIQLTLGGFIYFGVGIALLGLRPGVEHWQGFFAVAVSLVYLGFGYVAMRRNREDRLLTLAFLGLSAVFLTLAIPVQLSGHWLPVAWAVESVVLIGLSVRFGVPQARWAGLAVYALALLSVLETEAFYTHSGALRHLAYGASIAAGWANAWLLARASGALSRSERYWAPVLSVIASLLTITWATTDINAHFEERVRALIDGSYDQRLALRSQRDFLVSTVWALYGLLVMVVGFSRRLRGARLLGIGVLGLTLAKVACNDIWNLEGGWRVVGLISVGLVLLAVSYLYFRFRDRITATGEEPR